MATNAQLLKLITALDLRVKALESRPAGTDYSAMISALQADVAALKALTCPEVARFQTIESALGILNADHVPTP